MIGAGPLVASDAADDDDDDDDVTDPYTLMGTA